MQFQLLIGRLLYATIFLSAGIGHFSPQTIGYAASQGVPLANIAVPLSGVLAILGGLSVALGFKVKWGVAALVLFLVPVTFMMHAFWTVKDPMAAQMQYVNFIKNLALIGGALFLAGSGAGELSVDSVLSRGKGSPSLQPQL
ncbi:MAG: DoxX family protein [Armatimonadetes bacterium]|nr:DoxX family protein [Armatimonadota bacterium]